MASFLGGATHLIHSEHSLHTRTWSPSVHGHLVVAVPQCCTARQQLKAALHSSSSSSGHAACTCCAAISHQQQQPGKLLACGTNNSFSNQHGQWQPQPLQHHRSGGAVGSGGNWALAACNTAEVEVTPSLGWNAGFSSKYRLGEVMGHGSFGTVHRAVHKQTGMSYAVKVLRKKCINRGVQLDAIQREVDTWQLAQRSKYVAKLEALFEDDEHAYIVQELCSGGTLKERLDARGCCSELDAATVMHGVLDLLVECHRRHICYRDLKPANIMFSSDQVRAIDFGSSHVSAHGKRLTETCGSPLYMAPEVGLRSYGTEVDVWSAGMMLYQMLTSRTPFWPKKTMDQVAKLPRYEVLAAVRNYEVQFPADLWGSISPAARDLVSRMLDRNQATRITAAEALQHAWLTTVLGFTPTPSSDEEGPTNNVVEFRGQHGSPLRPVPMSPGRGSIAAGPLSPQKSSPLRSMLSGELSPSMLVADMHRAPIPAMVPAAE